MARPLRVEYADACYHIINRGNRREVVFTDGNDCDLFLLKLIEFSELYDIVIYTYCLMPNHFHLYLRTRQPNLSKFMQSFLTSFTLSMNRKYMKSEHLFQGRYKAQLVESELYKNKLSRYIHLNPIKIKACEGLKSSTLKERLYSYKWSSLRSYIGLEEKPKWLDRRYVLSYWGRTAVEKMQNYRIYVEDGIKTDNAEDIKPTEISSIIGSGAFMFEIKNKYLSRDVSDIDIREQPVLATANAFSVDDVLKAVCDYYGTDNHEKVTVRRNCNADARKMAMFLSGKHCRRKATLTSMAGRFGVNISGFNMAGDRFRSNLRSNKSLQKDVIKIEENLKSNKVEV